MCVSIGALHDDGGRGTVSARLALQQTRNFSAGDHSTLQEVWDARLKHTRDLILIYHYDNHTRSRWFENRREREYTETRNSESGLVSVVCVSIGALHDDG